MNYVYSRKVYISTNLHCNLKCIYCYEKDKKNIEFNVEEAFSILKEILSVKTEHGTKIKFHGGEPFLSFTKIKYLCERLWEENLPEFYRIHITTNGTLIHGEIQEWLYANREKILLKLSLDGNKQSNDINRPNSFNLIDVCFFANTWPDIRVNMTITPLTLPYFAENVRYLHSVGFQYIYSRFALMTDWSNNNFKKEFYGQLHELIEFYLNNPHITPCELFEYDISWTLEKRNFTAHCNVGNMQAYDFQTKKFYPCHMCFPSVCGDKLSNEFQKIELREDVEQCDKCCTECPFINICLTCYAENYITRGSVSRRDLHLCSYKKIGFLALFQYEYERIIQLENPSSKDVMKMMAIQKWHAELCEIEEYIFSN